VNGLAVICPRYPKNADPIMLCSSDQIWSHRGIIKFSLFAATAAIAAGSVAHRPRQIRASAIFIDEFDAD
jgi:hypothetical protein